MPPRRQFVWDRTARRYRDAATGRFVTPQQVRTALDGALRTSQSRIATLADDLRMGRTTLIQWEFEMRQAIKDTHLYSMALAKGGWANMTHADYGRVGQIVQRQYAYLNRFAAEIERGLPFNGTYTNRSTMYAEAARHTFYQAMDQVMTDAGYTEEANVLTPAEHCQGAGSCVEQTARGWVPVGALIPIGERKCLVRCRCRKQYRRPVDNVVTTV